MRVTCGNPRMSVVCLSAWNSSRSTPDQGTTIVIELWTTPDWIVMTDDRLATCAWPTSLKTRLATNLWLYRQFAAELGPDRINMGVISEESSVWSLPGTCDPMSILCHSYVDPMSLASHSRVTLKLLCPSYVTRQTLPLWRNFKSALRRTYVRAEWNTSPRVTYDQFVRDLQPTYEPVPRWPLGKRFPTVWNRSIRSGNLCRAIASPTELLRVFRSNVRPSDKKHTCRRNLRSCRPTPDEMPFWPILVLKSLSSPSGFRCNHYISEWI